MAPDLPAFKMESPRKKPKLQEDRDYAPPFKKSEKESPKVGNIRTPIYLQTVRPDLAHRKFLWQALAQVVVLTPLHRHTPPLPLPTRLAKRKRPNLRALEVAP